MRLRAVHVRSSAVASVALVGLLVGCSGSQTTEQPSATEQPTSAQSAEQTTAAPSSPAEPSSASPSESSKASDSGGQQITTAGGALTFTLPCAKPREQDIEGNDRDKKTYASFQGWTCGEGKKTTANSGAFLVELIKTPADDDAAHRELQGAAQQLYQGAKPEHGTFQGHPGVTMEVTANGRKVALQGVSFDNYLALFLAAPADDLPELTDTVSISA